MIHVKDNDGFNEIVAMAEVRHGQILDVVENTANWIF